MRLTESVLGIVLLAVTFIFAVAGLVSDLQSIGDPPAFFGSATVTGIAAVAVALDEHRRKAGQYRIGEVLLGRVLIAASVCLGVVSFVLAIEDSNYRNLWSVLAIIVGLVGVSVVIDSHRLIVARSAGLETRSITDAILGALAAALGLGFGFAGILAGLVDNPHASGWLEAGVVLAVLSVALMFDEQAHVVSRARRGGLF
jgi:hypothetical protein